jgi:hypothetical protein
VMRVGDLARGIYFMSVSSAGSRATRKIIVE